MGRARGIRCNKKTLQQSQGACSYILRNVDYKASETPYQPSVREVRIMTFVITCIIVDLSHLHSAFCIKDSSRQGSVMSLGDRKTKSPNTWTGAPNYTLLQVSRLIVCKAHLKIYPVQPVVFSVNKQNVQMHTLLSACLVLFPSCSVVHCKGSWQMRAPFTFQQDLQMLMFG